MGPEELKYPGPSTRPFISTGRGARADRTRSATTTVEDSHSRRVYTRCVDGLIGRDVSDSPFTPVGPRESRKHPS